VLLALETLLPERPDWVLSGINHGPNMGEDVTYSGTVAAAMEGSLLGVPAIAISLAAKSEMLFDAVAPALRRAIETLLKFPLLEHTLLNVNLPNLPAEQIQGVRITRLGSRQYRDQCRAAPRPARPGVLLDRRHGARLGARRALGCPCGGGRLDLRHTAVDRPDALPGARGSGGALRTMSMTGDLQLRVARRRMVV
jgi:hypothetical protein